MTTDPVENPAGDELLPCVGDTNERPADGGRLVYDFYRSLYEEVRQANRVLDAKMFGVALLSLALAAVGVGVGAAVSGPDWVLANVLLLMVGTGVFFYDGQTRSGTVKAPGTTDWPKTYSSYLAATGEDMLLQVVSNLHESIKSAERVNAYKWAALGHMYPLLLLQAMSIVLLALLARL